MPILSGLLVYFFTFRFDRDWKKIEAFVGSKTVIQVKTEVDVNFYKMNTRNSGFNFRVESMKS